MTFHWVRFFGLLAAVAAVLVLSWAIAGLGNLLIRMNISPLWMIAILIAGAAAAVSFI